MDGWDECIGSTDGTRDFAGGETTPTPDRPEAASYPAHDCYSWQRAHYVSTADYHATVCGTCDKIIGFRWRKWSQRLRSLFSSDPHKRTFGE